MASDGPNRAVSGTRQGDTNTHIVEGIRDGIISEDHTTQGSNEFIPDLTYSMTDRMDVVIQEQSLPTLQQAASILSSLKRKRDEIELEIRVSMKKSRLFCWKVDRGGGNKLIFKKQNVAYVTDIEVTSLDPNIKINNNKFRAVEPCTNHCDVAPTACNEVDWIPVLSKSFKKKRAQAKRSDIAQYARCRIISRKLYDTDDMSIVTMDSLNRYIPKSFQSPECPILLVANTHPRTQWYIGVQPNHRIVFSNFRTGKKYVPKLVSPFKFTKKGYLLSFWDLIKEFRDNPEKEFKEIFGYKVRYYKTRVIRPEPCHMHTEGDKKTDYAGPVIALSSAFVYRKL